MKNLIKLLALTLIFATKNISTFAMDLSYESKVDAETKALDEKESVESSAEKFAKINAYRSKCLEECGLYKDVNGLVQEYDPIKDEWECEQTLKTCADQSVFARSVSALCLLPGNKLASGPHDNTIKIWDLTTGKCISTLKHTGNIYSLCSLPENKLAATSYDNTIKIWDLNSRKCILILKGHVKEIHSLCSLPGNMLASGSWDGTIKIWDLNTYGKCITTLITCTEAGLQGLLSYTSGAVYSLCLLPGNKLAASYEDTIKIWDLNSEKCITTLTASTSTEQDYDTCGSIYSLCSLPGNKLASGSRDNTIKIWDLDNYECIATLEDKYSVVALCSLPGNKLASGSGYKIKIWNLDSGLCENTLTGHTNSVVELCILPGNKLASASYDNSVKIWNNPVITLDVPN